MVDFDLSKVYISGITDDDLRETAYEILLASAGASGYATIVFYVYMKCNIWQLCCSVHLNHFWFYFQRPHSSSKRKEKEQEIENNSETCSK